MVEYRIMAGTMPSAPPAFFNPNGTCSRRLLRGTALHASQPSHTSGRSGRHNTADMTSHPGMLSTPSAVRRALLQTSTTAGSQGRNPDGSCPTFPDTNLWHLDVSQLPVHPNSASIKLHIA